MPASDKPATQLQPAGARRSLVKAGLGALAAPAVLRISPANAQSRVIKIGHVSPRTGPLAGFGEADGFILDQVPPLLRTGLQSGGKTYPVHAISKDSPSTRNPRAELAPGPLPCDPPPLPAPSATPRPTQP